MAAGSGGSKQKKPGRNKIWCSQYKARFTREKNKLKKVTRHLRAYPDDKVAVECVKILKATLGVVK